jgi:two-component system, chemotaxis family, chemotaxis protein CheY
MLVSQTPPTSKVSILIVDDQPVVRCAVRSALEKWEQDSSIQEVDNGAAALTLMQSEHFDIIFCDIQMPGISGPEALVHAYGSAEKRPIMVLMSAQTAAIAHEIGRRVGVYEFMGKPFSTNAVLQAVKAYERMRRVSRVLIVDDSATVRRLISRLLEKSQFLVEMSEACSGPEAITLSKNQLFDIVFCDFNMPGLDGIETAGQILQNNPQAQIVVISTEQPDGLVRSVQFTGAFAFLRKPFGASDVDVLLHDAFALKRPSLAKPSHAILSNTRSVPPSVTGKGNAGNFGSEGVA